MRAVIQNTKINTGRAAKNVLILLPFFIVFGSEILQFFAPGISSYIKILGMLYMFGYAVISLKYSKSLLITLLLFLPFFLYGMAHSFNIKAALLEGVRYLFPISVLMYGFSIRKHFKLLLHFFIIFALINDVVQVYNYFQWLRGVAQWFYLYSDYYGYHIYNQSSGIIRATGIVGFFGLFGFLNVIAFFITRRYYGGKWKKWLLAIFAISVFLSLSYKTMGTFIILLFIENRNKLKVFAAIGVIFVLALVTVPKFMADIFKNLNYRVEEYVTQGYSARGESYRVMVDEIRRGNLFGRGVGSFGGPESVTYESPVYYETGFNWYTTTNLTTTDTYFPHLFIEMGLVGAIAYLLVLLAPLIFLRWKKTAYQFMFVVYFALFFDSLFSYSLNNIAFLMISLVFVYPVHYYTMNREDMLSKEQSKRTKSPML